MTVAVNRSCSTNCKMSAANSNSGQVAKLSHNRRYCSEFPFFETIENCCEIEVRVCEGGSNTSLVKKAVMALVPEFIIKAAKAGSDDWQLSTPEILNLF
jgi:hypothetical protein